MAYQHVVATFTRLVFDLESFHEYRFLIIWLPILMVVVMVPIVFMTGPWILATAYLYWQWFHYMRQSYGIARIYQRKVSPNVPQHVFLSTLSQKKNMVAYFAVCLLIATIVYKSIVSVLALFAVSTLPLALIVYQTINFHHYLVDGVVWKIRKRPISHTLGIAS